MARFLGKQVSYPYSPILTILLHPKKHSGWAQGTSRTGLFPEADCPLGTGWHQADAGGMHSLWKRGHAVATALLSTWTAAWLHWTCLFTSNLARCPQERLWLREVKNTNILSLSWALPSWEPEGPDIGLNSPHFRPLPGNSSSPPPPTHSSCQRPGGRPY